MKRRSVFVLAACIAAVAFGAAVVGGIALYLRYGNGGGESASWGGSQYLDLHLVDALPEQPAPAFGTFLDRTPVSLRTVVRSLDRAAKDSRVSAVVLRLSVLPGAGWGKVEELRSAITRFRASGKPAYAHLEFAGNKEYYLASACT